MPRIFAFHLLNDFSGSPKILGQLLKGWVAANHTVTLHTSTTQRGFLSNIPGVTEKDNHYKFYSFLPLRLVALLLSQLHALVTVLSLASKKDIIYVNTMLPFGAAIGGKLIGAKVIYHIHETSITPKIFKIFLRFWVSTCAAEVIYVSNFVARAETINKPSRILWNALENDFAATATNQRKQTWQNDQVLMIASLKAYKGLDEYIALANSLPALKFDLVLNASREAIAVYFDERPMPDNLSLYPAQENVHPFYQRADIVVNLSRPEAWQETFGLTALEAMSYGIPVIVPPVGGIAEVVEDCITGFHLNGKDTPGLQYIIDALRTTPSYYRFISEEAVAHAANFSESEFINKSLTILTGSSHQTKTPVLQ